MGKGLRERDGFRQPADVAGLVVPEDEFLTPAAMGASETLVRGCNDASRPRSLEEAISSQKQVRTEARPTMSSMPSRTYLRGDRGRHHQVPCSTLRLLPLDPRYDFDDYR